MKKMGGLSGVGSTGDDGDEEVCAVGNAKSDGVVLRNVEAGSRGQVAPLNVMAGPIGSSFSVEGPQLSHEASEERSSFTVLGPSLYIYSIDVFIHVVLFVAHLSIQRRTSIAACTDTRHSADVNSIRLPKPPYTCMSREMDKLHFAFISP